MTPSTTKTADERDAKTTGRDHGRCVEATIATAGARRTTRCTRIASRSPARCRASPAVGREDELRDGSERAGVDRRSLGPRPFRGAHEVDAEHDQAERAEQRQVEDEGVGRGAEARGDERPRDGRRTLAPTLPRGSSAAGTRASRRGRRRPEATASTAGLTPSAAEEHDENTETDQEHGDAGPQQREEEQRERGPVTALHPPAWLTSSSAPRPRATEPRNPIWNAQSRFWAPAPSTIRGSTTTVATHGVDTALEHHPPHEVDDDQVEDDREARCTASTTGSRRSLRGGGRRGTALCSSARCGAARSWSYHGSVPADAAEELPFVAVEPLVAVDPHEVRAPPPGG